MGVLFFIEGVFMDNDKSIREFGKYVFLNIFAQIAFSCYTLMDTYFVSWRLKADGLSLSLIHI